MQILIYKLIYRIPVNFLSKSIHYINFDEKKKRSNSSQDVERKQNLTTIKGHNYWKRTKLSHFQSHPRFCQDQCVYFFDLDHPFRDFDAHNITLNEPFTTHTNIYAKFEGKP